MRNCIREGGDIAACSYIDNEGPIREEKCTATNESCPSKIVLYYKDYKTSLISRFIVEILRVFDLSIKDTMTETHRKLYRQKPISKAPTLSSITEHLMVNHMIIAVYMSMFP